MSAQKEPGRAGRTRAQLIHAAESLIVKKGLENVSVREIVREAGQKNESALQYHFKSRDGLIHALEAQREEQLEARRSELVGESLQMDPRPDLRTACALLIQPAFLLCREDKEFREFLGVFGQRLIASGQPVTAALTHPRSASQHQLREILHKATSHLDARLFNMRLEAMGSLVLLSLSRRARDGGSFRGRRADLFINNLADLMAAMLSAPVSSKTQEFFDSK